jgi:hypothetical protein
MWICVKASSLFYKANKSFNRKRFYETREPGEQSETGEPRELTKIF